MVSVREVEPEVVPASIGRPPRPRPPETGEATIWQVYSWSRAPLARRYLYQVACDPACSVHMALYKAGSKAKSRYRSDMLKRWREAYPGFRELEEKLRNEPITAAHFIAIVSLPKALEHFAKALEGAGKGKDSAARMIVQVANIQSRTSAKKGSGEMAGGGKGMSLLEAFLESAGEGDDEDEE